MSVQLTLKHINIEVSIVFHPVKTHLLHVKVAEFDVVITDELQRGITVALRIELNVTDFGWFFVSKWPSHNGINVYPFELRERFGHETFKTGVATSGVSYAKPMIDMHL